MHLPGIEEIAARLRMTKKTAVVFWVVAQLLIWGNLVFSPRKSAGVLTFGTSSLPVITCAIFLAIQVARRDTTLGWITFTLANAFLCVLVNFVIIYWDLGTTANFSERLSRVDALYFALGTLTTAGTGSIAPTSELARGLVAVQMIVDFVFLSFAIGIAVTRVSERKWAKD